MFQMRPDIADAIGNSFHQNYYNNVDPQLSLEPVMERWTDLALEMGWWS